MGVWGVFGVVRCWVGCVVVAAVSLGGCLVGFWYAWGEVFGVCPVLVFLGVLGVGCSLRVGGV